MSLTGKVCIVTGASRGIGRGIALQLGAAGATIYITGKLRFAPVYRLIRTYRYLCAVKKTPLWTLTSTYMSITLGMGRCFVIGIFTTCLKLRSAINS